MDEILDISEVARRTGLTSRALRFYEARGLLAPLRTGSGRRLYGPEALERLSQIQAMKRAGLTIAQIQRLTARRSLDISALIDAQLDALDARQAEIAEARKVLLFAKSRIDRGEPVDAATFCSLIRYGDTIMESENWKAVIDRQYSKAEQAEWAERAAMLPEDFDQAEYGRQWAELTGRIEARLPLDPAGKAAQALLAEWKALLQPFAAVATPEMVAGAARLHGSSGEWKDQQKPPISPDVWAFIQAAGAAASAKAG